MQHEDSIKRMRHIRNGVKIVCESAQGAQKLKKTITKTSTKTKRYKLDMLHPGKKDNCFKCPEWGFGRTNGIKYKVNKQES